MQQRDEGREMRDERCPPLKLILLSFFSSLQCMFYDANTKRPCGFDKTTSFNSFVISAAVTHTTHDPTLKPIPPPTPKLILPPRPPLTAKTDTSSYSKSPLRLLPLHLPQNLPHLPHHSSEPTTKFTPPPTPKPTTKPTTTNPSSHPRSSHQKSSTSLSTNLPTIRRGEENKGGRGELVPTVTYLWSKATTKGKCHFFHHTYKSFPPLLDPLTS